MIAAMNTQIYRDFEELVIPHKEALHNFAFKMTKNQLDAEDLVQDTLLKAFRFFEKFEKGTNIKAWLFMIMKNTFINLYRKVSKQPAQVDYEDIQNFYDDVAPEDVKYEHTTDDAFSRMMPDEISDAISNLQEDYRTVIILSDIEGYTYEEIAEFIDRPVGTVRSRLHRARKMLYAKLHDYAADKGFVNPPLEQVAA
ncbi:MAG: sigma-70 family RNA polymerase sigma factor [Melioribacteraceae bacterium]|nr:sigma-70 family RNA polymerase sigma factor [Melioribacteraceae bacterium]